MRGSRPAASKQRKHGVRALSPTYGQVRKASSQVTSWWRSAIEPEMPHLATEVAKPVTVASATFVPSSDDSSSTRRCSLLQTMSYTATVKLLFLRIAHLLLRWRTLQGVLKITEGVDCGKESPQEDI